MVEPDPWNVIDKNQENTHNCVANQSPNHETNANQSAFEDNFSAVDCCGSEKLPDSSEYIQALERKLSKLKNSANILEQSNRRRDILRYIQPEQPINLGELVTIIHHDQLDQEQKSSTDEEDANNH